MNTTVINNDIKVFYVNAESFPDGILAAHQKLHSMVPYDSERNYYGISSPEEDSEIIYRAATEEKYDGEATKYDFETLILKCGKYKFIDIIDYKKDPGQIGIAFDEILEEKDIDPQGYCVEHYLNDESTVRCMVRVI